MAFPETTQAELLTLIADGLAWRFDPNEPDNPPLTPELVAELVLGWMDLTIDASINPTTDVTPVLKRWVFARTNRLI